MAERFDADTYWKLRHAAHGEASVAKLGDPSSLYQQKHLLAAELREAVGMHPGRVLDFGCGWGRFADVLAQLEPEALDGVDLVDTVWQKARHFYDNPENEPRPPYDVVVAVTVLQHVMADSDVAAVGDLIRTGGRLIVVELWPGTSVRWAEHVEPRTPSRIRELVTGGRVTAKDSQLPGHYIAEVGMTL